MRIFFALAPHFMAKPAYEASVRKMASDFNFNPVFAHELPSGSNANEWINTALVDCQFAFFDFTGFDASVLFAYGGWINLRESIACPQCGLSGRKRQALSVVLSEAKNGAFENIHALERITSLFAMFRSKELPMEGSEYVGPGCAPGSLHTVDGIEVRHEDVHRLSYDDGVLDMICHFDVLEHVADYRLALSECARVLRPGGMMIFTVPFFGRAEHIVRAEVKDGEIVHHLPATYHGNPMSPLGSLVYFVPGWPLLDDLRNVGFARAEIGLSYDAFQGIVGDNNPYPAWRMWPVIFRAVKA
jgi:SAM-dependent methyltransferase